MKDRSWPATAVALYRREKQGWDVPGAANRVGFDGLISALQEHWSVISKQYPGIDNITVIGIDLTKRRN
ncbi:hypothetical protein [Cupriavidus necator]|uniref:hypothetical protein n=1 Tax=Cupriavidus necator TaxID=106590 RepID=UPI0012D2B5C3|nr:hypothetical protein [Cupriavidus necator]